MKVDPGTVSRTLATLVRRGYASKLPDRRYTVGLRSLRLAGAWVDAIVSQAAPRLRRIAEATGETVHLTQLLGHHAVTVTRLSPGASPTSEEYYGDGYPLWATAAGHALLSQVSPTERKALLPAEPYAALTDRTPTSWAHVWASIQVGQQRRVFLEEGQYNADFGCVAAPLAPTGRGEILAIALSYRRDRDESFKALAHKVVEREARDLDRAS